MKKNLDLTKILKNAPEGIELYSLIHGKVKLLRVKELNSDARHREIICKDIYGKCVDFLYNGHYSRKYDDGICVLYPSEDCYKIGIDCWENGYKWPNWQSKLFTQECSIGHIICRPIYDALLDEDMEMYLIMSDTKCIDIYGKMHLFRDIDTAFFEFGDSRVESMFFSKLNSNGYSYNKDKNTLVSVQYGNHYEYQIAGDYCAEVCRDNENKTILFVKHWDPEPKVYKPKFKINDYIWSKDWKQMAAVRQYKVIHVTESGYVLKQVDHKGRLWKTTQDITYEYAEYYEVVPEKYVRKLEHKFNMWDEIISLKDNNSYTIIEIIPDYGYKAKDNAQLAHYIMIPFKDEVLYELAGTEKDSLEKISLKDREIIAIAEDTYLKTEGYKLEETMCLDDLKAIEEDIKNQSIEIDAAENLKESEKHEDVPFNWDSFAKVIVRQNDSDEWKVDLFSHKLEGKESSFMCVGDCYRQCIPYTEETENLIGTKNNPPCYYISW